MCGHKANVNVPHSTYLASTCLASTCLEARLAEMFSIMLECNKLPVKATTKTTKQMEWEGDWNCAGGWIGVVAREKGKEEV